LKLRKHAWFGVVVVLVLVGVVLAVAACGEESGTTTAAGGEQPVQGGTLRLHMGEISFIDPSLGFESEGIQVIQAVFDGLTQYDFKTNDLMPDVATSWDANADATVWKDPPVFAPAAANPL